MRLAQGHNTVTPVSFEPAALLSWVKHSTTEPQRSLESSVGTLWVAKGNKTDQTVWMPRPTWTITIRTCGLALYAGYILFSLLTMNFDGDLRLCSSRKILGWTCVYTSIFPVERVEDKWTLIPMLFYLYTLCICQRITKILKNRHRKCIAFNPLYTTGLDKHNFCA